MPGLLHRQHGGSKLYEFVWVVLLVGGLATVAQHFMLRYIEDAERSAMENTVMNMRSALRLRLAEVLLHNNVNEAIRLARGNPINWLQETPPNYAGEFSSQEANSVAPGKWYYDRDRHELVYLVDNGRDFIPDREGVKRVRWRIYAPSLIKAVKENRQLSVNDAVGGISLVLVEPYRWEFK